MTLASYVPRSRLRAIARSADTGAWPSCEEGQAAVMMVDLAQFTRVTERLAAEGSLGAEKMSRLLDTFYGEVSLVVADAGGDVIAFAGDGILSMWPVAGEGYHAVTVAARSARRLARRQFGDVGLRARAVVGFGTLRTYELVAESRRTTLFAGPCIGQLRGAAAAAKPGEVILSASASTAGEGWLTTEPTGDSLHRLLRVGVGAPRSLGHAELPMPEVSDQVLRRFLPPMVSQAHGGTVQDASWAAGFRNVSVLFVNLTDVGDDPLDVLDTLQTAFEVIEDVVKRHRGTTYQFLMDDNGISAVIAFGVPGTVLERHESRSLQTALVIKSKLEAVLVASSIGVASGRLFCGVCGTSERRAYALVGHPMNVAARLMQHGDDDILCDEPTSRAGGDRVALEKLGPVSLDGLALPVRVARPTAPRQERARYDELVGRQSLVDRVQRSFASPTVVVLEGEAGVGKSHLLAQVGHQIASTGWRVITAEGVAVERETGFFPWRAVLLELLGGEEHRSRWRETLAEALADVPELASWSPVLHTILDLGLDETDVTREMTASAHADSLCEILVHLLKHATRRRRLLLLLDDLHWFDSGSLRVLAEVIRKANGVGILVGTRPTSAAGAASTEEVLRLEGVERIVVSRLLRPDARELVARRLRVDHVPHELEAFVWERAEGHPLHTEELALALVAEGVVEVADGRCSVGGSLADRSSLSTSLEASINSRFDRVSATAQLLVRTAAVAGAVFSPDMLRELCPMAETPSAVGNAIVELVDRAIFVETERGQMAFRHVTMRDVVYEGLLHEQRQELHRRTARWLEHEHRDDPKAVFSVLAHHCEGANEIDAAIAYLERAAGRALATFANHEAKLVIGRAMRLADAPQVHVTPERRARWLDMLAVANLMLTDIETAGELFRSSLELRAHHVPRSPMAIGGRLMVEAARQVWHRLRRAEPRVGNHVVERMRTEANAYGRLSEIAYFQNRPLELVHNCLRSLNAAETSGQTKEMAQGYAGTSIVLVLLGMQDRSRRYRDRGLALAETALAPADAGLALQLSCVHALSVGDWDVAERSGERAVEINRRLGDRFRMQTCLITTGFRWLFTADFERADALLHEAVESAGSGGAPQILFWGYGGRIVVRLARASFELPFLEELETLLETHAETSSSEQILCHGVLAAAHARMGDATRALASASRVLERLERDLPVTYYLIWAIAAAAEVEIAEAARGRSGSLQRAQRLGAVLQKYGLMLPTARPASDLVRGQIAALEGRTGRAKRLWQHAARRADALSMPVEGARARLYRARLDNAGKPRAELEQTLRTLGAGGYLGDDER